MCTNQEGISRELTESAEKGPSIDNIISKVDVDPEKTS